MSRTAMGIDHLTATGQPDPLNPGADLPVPVTAAIGRFAQAPLGFIHVEPASQNPIDFGGTPIPVNNSGAGDEEWIYVFNSSGADLLPGTLCQRELLVMVPPPAVGIPACFATAVLAFPESDCIALGVAQYLIPDGFFGFLLRKGLAIVAYPLAAPIVGGLPLIPNPVAPSGLSAEGVIGDAGFGVTLTNPLGGLGMAIIDCSG